MTAQTVSTRRKLLTHAASGLIILVLSGVGCRPAAPPIPPATQSSEASSKPHVRKIVVAMAADLRFVATELLKEFEQQAPDIQVEPTFGSSGKLFAQISNHGPFDVFLSADIQYPQKLAEQGLTKQDSLFRYAIGHIVLWVRTDSQLPIADQGAGILQDPRVKKFAIANPKLAPYGRAAEAALKKLNLYDSLQDKLVLGENVAQAAQFAESGAADAAVIGLSLAMAPEFAKKGNYWNFPPESYPQMEQGGVILAQTQDEAAAQQFCAFLQTTRAQEIFQKYGFGLPGAL